MPPELVSPVRHQQAAKVDHGQVAAIAAVLRRRKYDHLQAATWDDPRFWNVEANPEERCQYLAIGNAINFRFWKLAERNIEPAIGTIQGESLRGSLYMWRRLRLAVDRDELSLDAAALEALDEPSLARAFTDDAGHNPLEPGLHDRLLNLQDLGRRLAGQWNGQFSNLIAGAQGSLETFAKLCAEMRAFDDPVRKLTMVNANMLVGSHLAVFDQSPLPGIDYHLVRQSLRQGLVVPANQLRAKLIDHELLDETESLNLRSAVLDALIEVSSTADVPTAAIDNLYWLNRRVCGDRSPACSSCPFEGGCTKETEYDLPLELTRYY